MWKPHIKKDSVAIGFNYNFPMNPTLQKRNVDSKFRSHYNLFIYTILQECSIHYIFLLK